MSAQYHLTRVISILINTNKNLNVATKMDLYIALNNYTSELMKQKILVDKRIEQLENKIEQLQQKNK